MLGAPQKKATPRGGFFQEGTEAPPFGSMQPGEPGCIVLHGHAMRND